MEFGSGLRVVIINGKPGAGKTTFENMCCEILGEAYSRKRSTIDKVKEIAKEAGWNGEKTPEARKMLSDLKNIFTQYNDMPLYDIVKYLNNWENDLAYYGVGNQPHVLFVDDREPWHIEKLKQALNAITVLIRRPGDEDVETSNDSDENVFNYEYDYLIENYKGLNDLRNFAQIFVNSIFN